MGIRQGNVLYGTAAEFTAAAMTLYDNQLAIETDTGQRKIGDGTTGWTSLPYSPGVLVTSPVSTVVVREYTTGKGVVTVLTLTDFIVGALAGSAAALAMGNIVAAFPAGQHLELAYAFKALSLKAAGTAVVTNTALGSVIGSGAVATLAGTATFMDRLTQVAITTAPAGGTAVDSLKVPTAGALTGIGLNVAASVKNVFLNAAGTWNANNTGNLTASGIIVLNWDQMQ